MLVDISHDTDVRNGDWNKTLEKITSTVSQHLNVSQTSVWLYSAEAEKIQCAKLYNSGTSSFEEGNEIHRKDCPAYFTAIAREEAIVVTDTVNNNTTRDFFEKILKPINILSLAEVPFFSEGKLAGIIRCAQQHTKIEWNDDQVEFINSCSDILSVAYNTNIMRKKLDELQAIQNNS